MKRIFPQQGLSKEQIHQEISSLKKHDVDWKNGKSFCLSYYGGDDIYELTQKITADFMSDNALNPTAFPSLKAMENDVVSMIKEILGSDDKNKGTMTSGGTESIMMAVKAAREWAKEHRPQIKEPEIVVPASVHPAFNKAAHYFGLKVQEVAVCPKNFTPDINEYAAKINANTILLVGSAPSYPQGVIDPIEDIAALAKKLKILCHVDACIGGLVLGFYRELGYDIPNFDLKVDGVTSISCDLHKYGFTPKGASVVLYKNSELRKKQFYCYTGWSGGIYISPTALGTRSGAPIAAAWATMKYLGKDGYKNIFKEIHQTTGLYTKKINEIDDLYTDVAQPVSSLVTIGSRDCDIYVLADHLNARGWVFDRNTKPASLHLSIMPIHNKVMDVFIKDLKECFDLAKKEYTSTSKVKKNIAQAFIKMTPAKLVKSIAKTQTNQVDGPTSKTASIYGMMGSLESKGALEDVALDLMDKLYDN